MRKLVMIGIDAACLEVINPWVQQGHLPHIAKLMSEGVYADLKSIVPNVTPPAWTSLVTGMNPGSHGITCEFFKNHDGTSQQNIVTALDNRAKCIWDYLTAYDMTSLVINVPVTHPAKKINGILVPGYLAPPDPVCYPSNILEELRYNLGSYTIYTESEIKEVSPEKTLHDFINATMMRKDAALYLSSCIDWDFLMVEFQKTDGIFHMVGKEGQDKYRLQLYECVDRSIGEILEKCGNNANVMIVSDHGIGKCRWSCCINTWLYDKGWLKYRHRESAKTDTFLTYKKSSIPETRRYNAWYKVRYAMPSKWFLKALIKLFRKTGMAIEDIEKIVIRFHLGRIGNKVPKSIRNSLPRKQIDWEKTVAYCPSPRGGIRLSVCGREPYGIVGSKEEYNDLRQQIIIGLRELKTPDGEMVFDWVGPREECYKGDGMESAPDILFIPNDTGSGVTFHSSGLMFRQIEGYGHTMKGIFISAGPDIVRKGYIRKGFHILDVAPTALHMLGLPVPIGMDGRVLSELFTVTSEPGNRFPKYHCYETLRDHLNARIRELRKSGRL